MKCPVHPMRQVCLLYLVQVKALVSDPPPFTLINDCPLEGVMVVEGGGGGGKSNNFLTN